MNQPDMTADHQITLQKDLICLKNGLQGQL